MEKLQNRIDNINKDFDAKIAKLNEERNAAISQAKVDDVIRRLPSMSIGNIITIFENISADILKTRDGRKTINAFVSLVKEDKNIASAYALMESVTKNVGIENPKEFITESVSVAIEKSDISKFNESKKKLVNFVSEAMNAVNPAKISDKIAVNEGMSKINDSLEILVCGKKSIKNTASRLNSINETVNFLSTKNIESKEEVFERFKNECMKSIDEAWEQSDNSVRLKLTEMKDKLSKKEYSELTADEDIKYMKELINTVK